MKTDPRFPKLHIVDHPLVQHKLSTMREKKTPSKEPLHKRWVICYN